MTFLPIFRAAAVLLLLLSLATQARAQSDHINLESGFGTRLEDAYPTAYGNRELQLPLTFQRTRDGRNVMGYQPTLELGLLRNTQFSVGVPIYSGNGDRTGSGNIVANALYNFNSEGLFVPAVALAGNLALPTGVGSHGTDYGGTFIFTKSILPTLGLHRLHANLVYRHNSQPQASREEGELRQERPDYWALRAGYSARILPLTLLMVDFVREQRRLEGQLGSSIEAGLRRQLNPRLVLSLGAAAGVGTDADKHRANVAIQQSF